MHLKPVDQQVIVITGASSGIGLATARAAARKGAKLVLAARSAQTLDDLARDLSKRGTEAVAVGCDVSQRAQVERVAQAAVDRFGRIDTWVNNAGVGLYGRLDQVSEDDSRRLFETNFWGVVNGSLAALPHLKAGGGALINVGSEVSEAAVPLLGMYTASKHAVKGFTDALRIEIEEVDKAPVSITLIQPTSVNTPFPHHARNYMDREPKLPTPVIDPDEVAQAVLDAAASPTRARKVGTMATVNTMMAKYAPGLASKLGAKQYDRQQAEEPPRHPQGILFEPGERSASAGQVHGTPEPQHA
jgi:short-subunit dehydrogenase